NGATAVNQTPTIQFNLSEPVQPGTFNLSFSPVPSGGTAVTSDYQNFTYQNATFPYGTLIEARVEGTDGGSNDIIIPSGGGAPVPNPWTFTTEGAPAGVVSASLSTVSASPASVTADGSSYSTITVTVNDGSSNPISGKTVTLSSSRGATDTISIVSGTTGADGKASFQVRSSTTGSATLTAIADGTTITQTAAVTFISGGTTLSPGDRFKSSGSTVYYYGTDGKRYIFPTEAVYFSWYSDYSGIKTVTDSQVVDVALGGNVVPKPGTYLVQFVNMDVPFRVIDPHVYAVDQSLNLRHITSSSVAQSLYGADWEMDIIAVPEVFFRIFSGFGADINFSGDYSKSSVESAIPTPNEATAI
ncbi:Ig-like domain-containing protein, partial [Patescibacteria group bacterium]|nr:Ig-like domain-containing protein [Patescibacteria group bacterium]